MQTAHIGRAALNDACKLAVEKDQFHEINPVAAVRLTNIWQHMANALPHIIRWWYLEKSSIYDVMEQAIRITFRCKLLFSTMNLVDFALAKWRQRRKLIARQSMRAASLRRPNRNILLSTSTRNAEMSVLNRQRCGTRKFHSEFATSHPTRSRSERFDIV